MSERVKEIRERLANHYKGAADEKAPDLAYLLDRVEQLHTKWVQVRLALGELHAQVWGECPGLLNGDSGGDADLDLEIRALLTDSAVPETTDG